MVFGPKTHNYVNSTLVDSTFDLTVPRILDPLLWQPYCYSRNHPADHSDNVIWFSRYAG